MNTSASDCDAPITWSLRDPLAPLRHPIQCIVVPALASLKPVAKLSTGVRYLLTTLLVGTFFMVRLAAGDHLASFPFLVFFPAVLIASLVCDRGAGVYASFLSAALALYFFIEPEHSFRIEHIGTAIALALFLAISLFLAFLIEALRTTVARLADTVAQLGEANDELKLAERRTDTLLHELNHRIRNDIHGMMILLRQEERKHPVANTREALGVAADRLRLLSHLYETLHRRGDNTVVDAPELIGGLCRDLQAARKTERPITIRADVESIKLNLEHASPIGLIINELVTNAYKYAFPDDRPGMIDVRFAKRGTEAVLRVSDNGVGFPPEGRNGGQGQRLVKALAEQIGGSVQVESSPGATFTIRFPLAEPL